jgi:Zn-dependent protease with chaperone function
MADSSQRFTNKGFAKTFVLPSLLVFLVPILALAFFLHAQSRFDARARDEILKQIRGDAQLTPEAREQAIAFFTQHPFSELVRNPEFAANVDSEAIFHFKTFRWMIWLSIISIAAGAAVFLLAGVCVLLSLRSQRAQYLSLSIGWQALRIYGALAVVIQGILVVALSFWVTALWFDRYVPKLILLAAICAFVGVAAVIKAIFKRISTDHTLEGIVIDRQTADALWRELEAICEKVGTKPPDQIIAGIDDNFFVTEMPVTVGGKAHTGKTLYVSLALLKQMRGAEADAVLAHEMAHFSGNDTLYSKKISPLLVRFGEYLQALYAGGITRPVFHFMHCFRALYELSLGRHSRQREFRADRIAVEVTSPRDLASALVRVTAYSSFRNNIQKALFKEEHALEAANISQRIDEGFPEFALKFAANPEIGQTETAHPFDSHPPLAQRVEAVGMPLDAQHPEALMSIQGDGRWYRMINGAADLEREQWREFEEKFRSYHEQSLPYRFLPASDEERAVVEKAFPPVSLQGKKGALKLDYATLHYSLWPGPVEYREISKCTLDENSVLHLAFRDTKEKRSIKLKDFGKQQQAALDAINRYYTRYLGAVAYQEQKKSEIASPAAS